MKLGKLRTLRGQVTVVGGVAKKNLVASDGLINFGLKISRFTVWPENGWTGGSDNTFVGILSLDTIASGSNMNGGDNTQIAWTFSSVHVASGTMNPVREIIDPDHIVNRDLFLSMDNTTNGIFNYLIECQIVELSDDEAIITIIKETSQS